MIANVSGSTFERMRRLVSRCRKEVMAGVTIEDGSIAISGLREGVLAKVWIPCMPENENDINGFWEHAILAEAFSAIRPKSHETVTLRGEPDKLVVLCSEGQFELAIGNIPEAQQWPELPGVEPFGSINSMEPEGMRLIQTILNKSQSIRGFTYYAFVAEFEGKKFLVATDGVRMAAMPVDGLVNVGTQIHRVTVDEMCHDEARVCTFWRGWPKDDKRYWVARYHRQQDKETGGYSIYPECPSELPIVTGPMQTAARATVKLTVPADRLLELSRKAIAERKTDPTVTFYAKKGQPVRVAINGASPNKGERIGEAPVDGDDFTKPRYLKFDASYVRDYLVAVKSKSTVDIFAVPDWGKSSFPEHFASVWRAPNVTTAYLLMGMRYS
jgi:hypothetical protein